MEIRQTEVYARWFRKLKDPIGKAKISVSLQRIRLAKELVGDIKNVGDGVKELRVHTGPGYRVYFAQHGEQIMLLLIGGNKTSQSDDIVKAKKLASEWTGETGHES